MRIAPLVVALMLSGCLVAAPPEDASFSPAPSKLHLDADGGMAASEASVETRRLEWGWLQWLDGVAPPEWTDDAAPYDRLVTSAKATVVYTAMHPVTSPQQRPEFTVWFGVEDSVVEHAFAEGPPTLLPGANEIVAFDLELPVGGLVVRKGERLVLGIGSYYNDDARQGGVGVVFGGAEGTRLELVTQRVRLPDERKWASEEGSVFVEGGRCNGFDPLTSADMAPMALIVPSFMASLRIAVDRASGTGPPDVDFLVLDAAGNEIAHAMGSAGHEVVRLHEPNFAQAVPGAWTLVVYACTPQRATVDVHIERAMKEPERPFPDF